jgi:hypothetical protein
VGVVLVGGGGGLCVWAAPATERPQSHVEKAVTLANLS